MKKNLVLVGMMGSGKSTIGKVISRKSGLKFLDTDELMEIIDNSEDAASEMIMKAREHWFK